jgi:hypothetical protein
VAPVQDLIDPLAVGLDLTDQRLRELAGPLGLQVREEGVKLDARRPPWLRNEFEARHPPVAVKNDKVGAVWPHQRGFVDLAGGCDIAGEISHIDFVVREEPRDRRRFVLQLAVPVV